MCHLKSGYFGFIILTLFVKLNVMLRKWSKHLFVMFLASYYMFRQVGRLSVKWRLSGKGIANEDENDFWKTDSFNEEGNWNGFIVYTNFR